MHSCVLELVKRHQSLSKNCSNSKFTSLAKYSSNPQNVFLLSPFYWGCIRRRLHEFTLTNKSDRINGLCICRAVWEEGSVFRPNPQYSPRIPGCGRNKPRVMSRGGGGMLKKLLRNVGESTEWIYTVYASSHADRIDMVIVDDKLIALIIWTC